MGQLAFKERWATRKSCDNEPLRGEEKKAPNQTLHETTLWYHKTKCSRSGFLYLHRAGLCGAVGTGNAALIVLVSDAAHTVFLKEFYKL